jgi:hypothetical protein
MKPPGLCLASLLLLACGDDDDGAPMADAAPGPDVLAPACDVGESASAAIGPAGGELTLCGARLRVAEGELAAPITFTIERVADAPAPGAPRELAGQTFRFSADAALDGVVEAHLPHGGATGRLELYAVVAGELVGFEACGYDEQTIWQSFGQLDELPLGSLGTFVAVVDTYPYAESRDDLGSGTLSATLGDRELELDVAAAGYAIDENYSESVNLTVEVSLDEPFEQLRLQLFVPVAGEPEGLYAQWYSPPDLYGFGQEGTSIEPEVVLGEGGRVSGTVTGVLKNGNGDSLAFSLELDVLPEYWRYPPEAVCAGPGTGE